MKILVVFLFAIFIVFTNSLTNKEAKQYLWDYRHVNNSSPSPAEYTEGLKDFQRRAHVPLTGVLDSATKEMMKTPRCFNPNMDEEDNENRVRRYALYGTKWIIKNLTYHVQYPDFVDKFIVDDGLEKAFGMWTKYTGIAFTKTAARFNAHIKIKFDHIDKKTTLAYAYYPSQRAAGIIIFSDRFTWTRNSRRGQNFYQIAMHEIGHTLGLRHTDIKEANMFEFAQPYTQNYKLHADDILGIQTLYNIGN